MLYALYNNMPKVAFVICNNRQQTPPLTEHLLYTVNGNYSFDTITVCNTISNDLMPDEVFEMIKKATRQT